MKQKRKCSAKDMLERLRGREVQVNIENEVQPQHQQSNNNQSNPSLIPNEVQPQQNVSMANNPQQHVNMTSSPSHEGTFDHDDPSLIPNEVQPQQKEAPLLVKVIGKSVIYVIDINLVGGFLVTTYSLTFIRPCW